MSGYEQKHHSVLWVFVAWIIDFLNRLTIQKAFAFFKYSRKNWDKDTVRTIEVAMAQNWSRLTA